MIPGANESGKIDNNEQRLQNLTSKGNNDFKSYVEETCARRKVWAFEYVDVKVLGEVASLETGRRKEKYPFGAAEAR